MNNTERFLQLLLNLHRLYNLFPIAHQHQPVQARAAKHIVLSLYVHILARFATEGVSLDHILPRYVQSFQSLVRAIHQTFRTRLRGSAFAIPI